MKFLKGMWYENLKLYLVNTMSYKFIIDRLKRLELEEGVKDFDENRYKNIQQFKTELKNCDEYVKEICEEV